MYYQVSCGYVCKREKKSTRFVRLALTGAHVANFFKIADFDLVFLHNTHILSVCVYVGLFVILLCLSCLSVCLSVCTVGMYRMFEHLAFCTFVCLSVCLPSLLHCLILSVSSSVYVCKSLFLYVCIYICTSVFLYICLSA